MTSKGNRNRVARIVAQCFTHYFIIIIIIIIIIVVAIIIIMIIIIIIIIIIIVIIICIIFLETLKYRVGVQQGQSYLMGRIF